MSKESRENVAGCDKDDSDGDDERLEKDERSRIKGKSDDGKSGSPSPKRRVSLISCGLVWLRRLL